MKIKFIIVITAITILITTIFLIYISTFKLHDDLRFGKGWFPSGYWRHIAAYEISKLEKRGKYVKYDESVNEISSEFGHDCWGKNYSIFTYNFNEKFDWFQKEIIILSPGKNLKIDGDYENYEKYRNTVHEDDIIVQIFFYKNKNALVIASSEKKYYKCDSRYQWLKQTFSDIYFMHFESSLKIK